MNYINSNIVAAAKYETEAKEKNDAALYLKAAHLYRSVGWIKADLCYLKYFELMADQCIGSEREKYWALADRMRSRTEGLNQIK